MDGLHTLLPRVWARRGLLAGLLWPLSVVYGLLVRWRRWAYAQHGLRSAHPGVPVIVIGNVVVGGAGKTPTVIAVVQHLLGLGLHVGVVSRGHGRQTRDVRAVHASSRASEVGDEPLLVARHTGVPVWVGAQRSVAAQRLLQAHPTTQVIVCDDGLQHHALQRDVEICLMDDRGTGNGWLLPAGPLREPWPRKVDLLLYTHGQRASSTGFVAQRRLADQAINAAGEHRALHDLATQPVDAVAGLARPEAFFGMLRAHGVRLAQTWALPDHHAFETWLREDRSRALLCTEKDAVKLWAHEPQAWAVPLHMDIEDAFWSALETKLLALGLPLRPLPPTATLSSAHGHQIA